MKKKIFYIMGVSGCGKSTIGKLLAKKLNFPFFDGDDYHSKDNLEKMASGKALTDMDRIGWLNSLNNLAREHVDSGAVIACSALKESYRQLLQRDIRKQSIFVYLDGSFSEIQARLEQRKDHFMPTTLLKSQFDTLEVPTNAITVAIDKKPEEIVAKVLSSIAKA